MPKGRNDWETPPWLFEVLHQEFNFTVDAAAQPHNAKLPRYWTPETDGLRQSWGGERVFCNPPYLGGRKVHWVQKAADEVCGKNCECAVLVLPADTECFWFHDLVMTNAHELRFVRRRIHFLIGGRRVQNGRPVFNSVVVVFRRGGRRFGPVLATSLHAPNPKSLWHGRTPHQAGQLVLQDAAGAA